MPPTPFPLHAHRPLLLFGLAFASGCAPAPRSAPRPGPPDRESSPPALPPVPAVDGPLAIRVVYPPANTLIQSRDSNFIFGSVGSGRASLEINGASVPVLPNGSFLAWLPVPPASAPAYAIVASRGADTARLSHPVAVLPPRVVLADTGRLTVDSASVVPRGARLATPDEPVRVSIRAPRNATVTLHLGDGAERALVNVPGAVRGAPPAEGDAYLWSTDVAAARLARPAELRVARGADTVRVPVAEVTLTDVDRRRWVMLTGGPAVSDTDRVVTLRPVPNGTYKWLLLPGTVLELTGRVGAMVRVRLDASVDAWASAGDVTELPAGTASPHRVAGNARVVPATGWVDLTIPMSERPAYEVRETGTTLTLVLYGVRANTDIIRNPSDDPLVRRVRWYQDAADRARYEIDLGERPYGYLPLWTGGSFTLRIRRTPVIDSAAPLRGRVIAVNAGHPPGGSTGPTGLYEPVPTLGISERLQALLEARGARVIMTRTTPEPLALAVRPVLARQANADAFVSIHLNALPDGVNPFTAHGTGTYYFHPASEPLARAIQRGLVRRMGLRDLGIYYDNLSDLRHPWMPSVLTEGAFIMIPEQEAALRTAAFQERYALGVADGLEAYFRALRGRP